MGPRPGSENSLKGWWEHSAGARRSGFALSCLGEQDTKLTGVSGPPSEGTWNLPSVHVRIEEEAAEAMLEKVTAEAGAKKWVLSSAHPVLCARSFSGDQHFPGS